jgi:hypothetical protein
MSSTATSRGKPSARRSSITTGSGIAATSTRATEPRYLIAPCGHVHPVRWWPSERVEVGARVGALTYVGRMRCRNVIVHVYERTA